MRWRRLLLYYSLLRLVRLRRGITVSRRKSDIMKRLVVLNMLARERRRLLRVAALARKRQERSCGSRLIFLERKDYGAWHTLVPMLREQDPKGHFNFFRMTVESFDYLLRKVAPLIRKTSNREAISPGERLAVTLRFLASGDSQISLSYLFRIADQTISNIVGETTAAIWFVLRHVVFEPLSPDFWRRKAAEFEQMWQFPMCVGAIDGKHCCVQKYPGRGSENHNYKGTDSTVLLALSDAKYKFILVDCGAKGREGDGGVFERSELGQLYASHALGLPPPARNDILGEDLPYVFVGDDAFTLDEHLMKPYSVYTEKEEETIFNYRLSRARRVVENAFGILTARFRILRQTMVINETSVQSVILACCALHNLHLMREDSIPLKQRVYLPEGYADAYKSNGFLKRGRWRYEDNGVEDSIFTKLSKQERCGTVHGGLEGQVVREKFVELFIGYPLPWQWDLAVL